MKLCRPSVLYSLCLSLLALQGCDGQKGNDDGVAGGDGTVKIEFWHYFSGEQADPLKKLIEDFHKENPGIEVRSVYQGRANDLSQKLNSSFAALQPNNPVMATLYENWTSDFVEKDYMDAVQDHFAGPDGLSQEEQDDIVKVFREGNSWNGKMVTMPFNKSIYVLYYNAEMLEKAGYTTAPKTLEEFKDAVIKTTDESKNVFGLGITPLSEAFTTLFYASGGEYLDANNNPVFDSPEGLAALSLLRDLQFPKKHLLVDDEYKSNAFGNRNIAMYIYSSASFPWNEKAVGGKFRWEVAPIPGMAGKEPRYVMQGTNIGIFKNRPEAERKAAWKFIKFLIEPKNSAYYETQSGYMPIRYSILNEPQMVEFMEKNPKYKMASQLVLSDKGKQEPKIAVWEHIRQDLDRTVDRVLTGSDPKTELTAAQANAADRIRQRNARTGASDDATTK